jgi:hypothetical protein
MQKKRILPKDYLIPFLRKLSKGSRLVAPVRSSHGDLIYQEIDSLDVQEPDLSAQPQESAKSFLFPQEERLFSYDCHNGLSFTPSEPGKPTVLFGLRSCDISAILYMDVIFMRSPRDDYYFKRRKDTVIIGIGCNEPWENCFCNATGSGPFLEVGFDLQFTDLGDRFFVESGRATGDAILEKWPQFFSRVKENDEKLRYQTVLERIREAERRYGRENGSVSLIAVSKTQPTIAIEAVHTLDNQHLAKITCKKQSTR